MPKPYEHDTWLLWSSFPSQVLCGLTAEPTHMVGCEHPPQKETCPGPEQTAARDRTTDLHCVDMWLDCH